jgi:hypothetical protein
MLGEKVQELVNWSLSSWYRLTTARNCLSVRRSTEATNKKAVQFTYGCNLEETTLYELVVWA